VGRVLYFSDTLEFWVFEKIQNQEHLFQARFMKELANTQQVTWIFHFSQKI